MGKRLTDPGKWERTWFRRLSPAQKCFVLYLYDRCDIAGVWVVDLETASFFIGGDPGDPTTWFPDGMIHILDDGKKWFIPKFVKFQNEKSLNTAKPINTTIRKLLAKHGVVGVINQMFGDDYLLNSYSLDIELSIINHSMVNDISNSNSNSNSNKKGVKGENNVVDFDAIIDANAAELRSSTTWLEQLAMAHKITMVQLNAQLEAFITDCKLKKDARPLDEWRKHFVNIVRKNSQSIRDKTPVAPAAKSTQPIRDELDTESKKHLLKVTGRQVLYKDELTAMDTTLLANYWARINNKPTINVSTVVDKFSINRK